MRTILIAAFGIWIGKEIFTTYAERKALDKEKLLRGRLERFIRDHLENATEAQIKGEVEQLLK